MFRLPNRKRTSYKVSPITAFANSVKEKPVFVASVVLFSLSLLFRLYFAGLSASKNIELKELYVHKQQLDQDVARLKYDDLRLSSISLVEQKAKISGFVPISGVLLSLDLNISTPIASANSAR